MWTDNHTHTRRRLIPRSGLEGQLLGVTIQHEQPELEKAKSEMLRQEEGFKVEHDGLIAPTVVVNMCPRRGWSLGRNAS